LARSKFITLHFDFFTKFLRRQPEKNAGRTQVTQLWCRYRGRIVFIFFFTPIFLLPRKLKGLFFTKIAGVAPAITDPTQRGEFKSSYYSPQSKEPSQRQARERLAEARRNAL